MVPPDLSSHSSDSLVVGVVLFVAKKVTKPESFTREQKDINTDALSKYRWVKCGFFKRERMDINSDPLSKFWCVECVFTGEQMDKNTDPLPKFRCGKYVFPECTCGCPFLLSMHFNGLIFTSFLSPLYLSGPMSFSVRRCLPLPPCLSPPLDSSSHNLAFLSHARTERVVRCNAYERVSGASD